MVLDWGGGFAKSEAAARQQIHDSKQSGAKSLGRIKLACFFRDASSVDSHNSIAVLTWSANSSRAEARKSSYSGLVGSPRFCQVGVCLRELFHIALAPFYIITMQTISTAACFLVDPTFQ